jgi:hypothetical protein
VSIKELDKEDIIFSVSILDVISEDKAIDGALNTAS